MTPLVFTLSQMLIAILIALLAGAFFGRRIAKEARELLRPSLGELMMREAKDRGAQVLRSQGLSIARKEDFEEEGRLAHDYEIETEKPEEQP